MADREAPAIDPALFQSPPLVFQPLDFDSSPSFDVVDTPADSPPTDAASLVAYTTTTNTSLDSPLPTLIIRDSPAREAALIQHFETHVLSNLPVPMAFGRSYTDNSCFRHAILALSAINKSYLETRTRESNPSTTSSSSSSLSTSVSSTRTAKTAARLQQRRSAVGREHYLAAVSSLYRRLDLSDPSSREQHAAAALMLAYYEIETGSPFGSLRHARGLDALLSRLDLHSPTTTTSSSSGGGAVPSSMPEIFKAWRILRYDVRHISAPYRATSVLVDAHDAYASLDPRLAIRDVYTLAWNLVGRVEMEASFPAYSPEKVGFSKSRQAATWIRDVAGRVCDRRNVERGDYHAEDITPEEVVSQCGRFSRGLDAWHAVLPAEGRPVVCAAGARPFVSGPGFEPFPILGFGGGDRVAVEYMMYVTARMIVSYLLSVFGDGQEGLSGGGGGGAAETAAWARVLLGVVCGMQHKHMMFSYVSPVSNVAQAVLLTEGAGMATAVLDGVIPHVLGQGIPTAELADWLYLKKGIEIVRRERVRGRSVRAFMLTLDEDYEKGHFDTECAFIVFGDYNGKGHFRDVYSIDGEF